MCLLWIDLCGAPGFNVNNTSSAIIDPKQCYLNVLDVKTLASFVGMEKRFYKTREN